MGDAATMALVGGHPAIDFVNTLGGMPDAPDDEYLHGYADLVVWGRQTGILPTGEATRLTSSARRRPERAGSGSGFSPSLAGRPRWRSCGRGSAAEPSARRICTRWAMRSPTRLLRSAPAVSGGP